MMSIVSNDLEHIDLKQSVNSMQKRSIIRDYDLADWMCERIVKKINDFEKSLPNDMQAGGRFVSTNNGYIFSIDDVGYFNPDMVCFYGTGPDGNEIELLQHTSQLNLLLVAVPRRDDLSNPRRKIGFQSPLADE